MIFYSMISVSETASPTLERKEIMRKDGVFTPSGNAVNNFTAHILITRNSSYR